MEEKEIKDQEEILNENNTEATEAETNEQDCDTSEATADEAAGKELTIEEQLEAAKTEIDDLKKQMLYKIAEFENFRKRTLKEKAELILNGGEKTVSAILPVLDDFERATQSNAKTDDIEVLREGFSLIFNKLNKTLEGMGVKKIETADADFNTDYHEAVAMVPGMGDDKKGKVIDCVQTGYTLNDKVIRHAKVAVGQ